MSIATLAVDAIIIAILQMRQLSRERLGDVPKVPQRAVSQVEPGAGWGLGLASRSQPCLQPWPLQRDSCTPAPDFLFFFFLKELEIHNCM